MAYAPAIGRWSRCGVWLIDAVGLFLFLSVRAAASPTLQHIRGLSYSADGQRLYIPMHHGLALYSGSRWSQAPGPEHDDMGFAVTHQFFYSSGHPAPMMGWCASAVCRTQCPRLVLSRATGKRRWMGHASTGQQHAQQGQKSHLYHGQDTHRYARQQRHVWTVLPASEAQGHQLHDHGHQHASQRQPQPVKPVWP